MIRIFGMERRSESSADRSSFPNRRYAHQAPQLLIAHVGLQFLVAYLGRASYDPPQETVRDPKTPDNIGRIENMAGTLEAKKKGMIAYDIVRLTIIHCVAPCSPDT